MIFFYIKEFFGWILYFLTSFVNNVSLFGVFMLFLIILTLALVYPQSVVTKALGGNRNLSKNSMTGFIISLIMISILAIILILIPEYKENFFKYVFTMKYVLLIMMYCIGLLIFFRSMDKDNLNKYADIISPITLLIGIVLFYFAMNSGPLDTFDINFERINYTLTYFLLIVFMLIFYTNDPGGYIKQYFGASSVISLLLAVFGLLYLITIMTLPTVNKSNLPAADAANDTSFFKGFTWGGIISGISFLAFLVLLVIGILTFPGGFTLDKTGNREGITILSIFIFMLWIIYIVKTNFTQDSTPGGAVINVSDDLASVSNVGKRVFTILFGIIFSCILIAWLVTITKNLTTKSTAFSAVLNVFIIISILGLVFKMIFVTSLYKNSALFRLIVNTILYIPCILVTLIDSTVRITGLDDVKNITSTPYTYYILLAIILLLYVVYFSYPYFIEYAAKQGGTLLVNQPVPLNSENILATYIELNSSDEIDYTYAISSWVYIDAINSATNKYVSILNYGDKPNILYNASINTLMITMKNTGENVIGTINKPQKLDANGNIIIHQETNILLQKWNNIIINYNGGTLDIFLNGELLKSVIEVIPKMTLDNLVIGAPSGIEGKICNVNYFTTALDVTQIYNLYNYVKNKTPPVSKDSKDTIIYIPIKDVPIDNASHHDIKITLFKDNIDPIKKQIDKTEEEDIESNNNPKYSWKFISNYLSPKWYFENSGDIYNG